MKKTATWLAALCAALLALPVMGCKDEQNSVAVENVTLNTTTLTLAPGGTGKLTATVVPSDADDRTVKWLSSNTDVVMVDSNGTVGAISVGIATITAQAGGKTAVCLITVKQESVAVERVTLDATALTIAPGGTRKLTATVLPSNADDTAVAWSSSNADVATVGTDGTVTAHAEGTATITAQAGGKTATCTVTVKPILIAVESVALDMTTLTLAPGKTGKLTATVLPGNADDKTVGWSSSEVAVAMVDGNGMVVAIKAGTATITARAGDKAAACTVTVQEVTENPEPVAVENVTLDATALTLTRGGTARLTATVLPENADDKTVTWSSSDPSVVAVGDDGTVTAVMVGSASITAQAGDKTATCVVTVNPIPVTDITLNASALTLTPGTTSKLTATVLPENADGVTVTWSSSDDKVATVDADGTVTTITEGTAVITAQAGGMTAECTVSVKQILIAVDKIALDKDTLMLTRGETGKLSATVTPDNADDTTVLWSSSDPAVATVDNDGAVTAHAAGTATITATTREGGMTATCAVTVNPIRVETVTLNTTTLTLTRGETGTLTATVTPEDADDTTVTWSSSDPSVATVDNDGTATTHKAGTATITARADGKEATCAVTVNPILVNSVMLSMTTLTLTRGTTGKLTATVTPSNADDNSVAWSSSDTSVATVGSDGTVTAVKAGTATITAQAGGKTATCAVTVNPILVNNVILNKNTLTLESNMTGKLTATVTPSNADDKSVAWSSSDTSVATVDADGTVTAVKAGTVTITVKAGGKTAECTLTVRTDHSYSGGKCTLCGAKPYLEGGTIDDNGVLTKYSGSATTVIIPDGVTGIGSGVFDGRTNLKSVTIPDSVTSIEDKAFYGCTGLTSVTIPGSVMSIGDCAFDGCTNLTSVTILDGVTSIGIGAFENCTNLKNVTIPEGVKEIGNYAFALCENLMSVTIPSSVTSIGNYAFSHCTGLTSVMIPGNVTSIGDGAFFQCTNLKSVTISGSMTSIGYSAFYSCKNLTSVIISDGVTSIGKSEFMFCTSLTSVTIPNSVTSIGDDAFRGCSSLKSVTIPDSVTVIGESAFYGCRGLKSVTIPGSVTAIGESAFYDCEVLGSVTILDGVTSIGKKAFWDCKGLTSVTIPTSMTSIEQNAFYGCSKLTTVNYNGTEDEWNNVTGSGKSALSGKVTFAK